MYELLNGCNTNATANTFYDEYPIVVDTCQPKGNHSFRYTCNEGIINATHYPYSSDCSTGNYFNLIQLFCICVCVCVSVCFEKNGTKKT